MRAVIDTNVFLVMVSKYSEHHWLFRAFLTEVFDLPVTNEILTEDEEKFSEHWDEGTAHENLDLILNAPNSFFCITHFRFNLIKHDPDDNKFTDCSVAANADYLVTFDKHFNVLKTLDFPKITVVHPDEFKRLLLDRKLIEP